MRPGALIAGRFELKRRAGLGGMGEIFQGLDTETGRLVALKFLRDASDRERFEQEARTLAQLHHPAIVRPAAYGVTEEGLPYLAMEWLEGEDLATLLLRRRLSVEEVLVLAKRVASALGEAHSLGLIHRDIKPANLFIENDDVSRTRLLDFGIARFLGQTRMTQTGTPLGTPGYMAPEQARGDEKLTPALDIFSLGCVLFELLAGRPPFEGQHMVAILAKVIFMEAPVLETYRPDVAPELSALVSRMLAKEPTARPQDGMALLADLTELEALVGGSAPSDRVPPSLPPPGSLTEDEQRMVSVVMIGRGRTGAQPVDGWSIPAEVWSTAEEVGGRQERLADGSIAITFGGPGVVKDHVALAARFAFALRAHHAEAPIALATGRGATRKATALGEAIERAAQRLAQCDEARASGPRPVAIDAMTAALLDARFEWREGEGGPELWGERDRAEAARTLLGKPTPCVGREIELRMLEQAFDTCMEEVSAQVFLVTAPVGMGKSRLAREFIQSIRRRAPEAAIWFGRADSSHAGSSLYLLGQVLRGALGLPGSEPPEAWRERLRARFTEDVASARGQRLREFLGELVGVPFPEPVSPQLAAARQDVQLMATQLHQAFEDFLLLESAAHPVVLILDDLHWGDTASMRFVDQGLLKARDRAVFVLGLARPEVHARFPRLWSERDLQEVRLRSLSRRASERLARSVLGEEFADQTLERLIELSEGNAFYLEELIRAVAEGKSALPDTVVAMVQSRLAALEPDARRVLRAASIFGEVFWKGATVALLGGMRTNQAFDWLLLLAQRELLVRREESRFPGETEFTFRHALLREGAYALLTEEDRRLGHRLAGEWLEQRGESDALALATHFERGGEPERAVVYYVRAAERASEADDAEAILSCTERGLSCDPVGEQRGALLSLKASAHVGREQYSEAVALSVEALELLPAGSRRWYMTYHHLFQALILSQPEAVLVHTRRFLEVPPNSEARGEYIRSATWLFAVLELTGAKDLAYDLFARVRAESVHLDARDFSTRSYVRGCEANHYHIGEQAPWSCAQADAESVRYAEQAELWRQRCIVGGYQGKALTDLGDYTGAEAVLRENLAVAERRGEAMSLTYARLFLARLLCRVAAPAQLEESEQLTRAVIAANNMSLLGPAHGVLAELALHRGDLEVAEAEARTACELLRPFPTSSWEFHALHVQTLLALGRSREALEVAEAALQLFERIGMAGFGEIDLRLAVAEAREATGQPQSAREMLRTTLSRLRPRVEDLPDAATRARYLTQVPNHARLLALARDWLGEEAVRAAGLGLEALGDA
ncbi:serine/threonine-protein kinase PknK [Hyalangium rubrum]|uniref:Protein kinase n=1 Tax=Hyalangium rubrum TaxID=3103134 RepID=A0ABU5HDZ4_9BACT|nr:protein kinase [Hyalangium sp. s54d21]MDY7231678.1 protein kinase [Hyalangium sp. s54d21]